MEKHLQRMKTLERRAEEGHQHGAIGYFDLLEARWRRIEAEALLSESKSERDAASIFAWLWQDSAKVIHATTTSLWWLLISVTDCGLSSRRVTDGLVVRPSSIVRC